jgi:hypothetical protein
MEEAAKDKIANMLNCQLGNLSMKYLGIPISDSKLGKGAFVELNGKVSKRIPPWRGKQSSSGGRLMHPHRHNGLLSTTLGDSEIWTILELDFSGEVRVVNLSII